MDIHLRLTSHRRLLHRLQFDVQWIDFMGKSARTIAFTTKSSGFPFPVIFPSKQQSGFHAPAPGFQPEMALDPLTQEYFKVPAPGYEADPSGMGAPGQTQSGSHSC